VGQWGSTLLTHLRAKIHFRGPTGLVFRHNTVCVLVWPGPVVFGRVFNNRDRHSGNYNTLHYTLEFVPLPASKLVELKVLGGSYFKPREKCLIKTQTKWSRNHFQKLLGRKHYNNNGHILSISKNPLRVPAYCEWSLPAIDFKKSPQCNRGHKMQ